MVEKNEDDSAEEVSDSQEVEGEVEGDDWSEDVPSPAPQIEGGEIIPPAPPIVDEDNVEEKKDDDDLDIVAEMLVNEDTMTDPPQEQQQQQLVNPYNSRSPTSIPQDDDEPVPDFSRYSTNVAERLWRAKKEAEKLGVTASPSLVPLAREYQQWRKEMGVLNKYIDEYKAAMELLSAKRNQLFTHYARLSEGTPLWDHIGKPLAAEQISEMQQSGDIRTLDGIESRTKSIMKVAEEIGPGSLLAHQQLSAMQEELNKLDYENHIVKYIDEWDQVVTSQLDDDVKAVRELAKNRDHYIGKVDKLREKVNKIEHRGRQDAQKKLRDQLDRNEAKLDKCDELYEKKANDVSVVLYEATKRGWVDLYPVIKNVMKFEINRLGRESSTYGSFHSTLNALKSDYKEATKNTADAPNIGSAL